MITWLFDKRNQKGFLPNLVKDMSLVPGSTEWWDLCIKAPFSYEFRFLKYCALDKIPTSAACVDDIWEGPAYYPVNLNFYDPEIDYFSLMEPSSLEKLKQGRFKFLFYYSEGDDPAMEINSHLDAMIKKHNVSKENVVFVTANWNINGQHPFIYFPDDELYYRMLHLYKKDWITQVSLDERPYKFTCLNRADKSWRRIYASNLHALGLLNEAQFSYTGYQYETSSNNEEDLQAWLDNVDLDNQTEIYSSFSMQIPFKCDSLTDAQHNDHKLVQSAHHLDSYWNFIVETHFDQDTCFLTEKTFKCILNLQPFIVVGSAGSLKLLHHLGYKTFSDIINERYDDEKDPYQRMTELIHLSYSIADRGHKDQRIMTKIMTPILKYNQTKFLAPKTQRIMNLLNKLEY